MCIRDSLDHQVGTIQRTPEFGFDHITLKFRQASQGILHQEMGPDMCAVPVARMRKENDLRRMAAQKVRDDSYRFPPMAGFLFACADINFLETLWRRLHQPETNASAASLQFQQALLLACFIAAMGDSDIHDVPVRLPQQAQRQGAHDHLVVGMGREKQGFGRIWSWRRARARGKISQGITSAVPDEAGVFGDEMMVGVHDFFGSGGRLAAAIAWPWRRSFSSGT